MKRFFALLLTVLFLMMLVLPMSVLAAGDTPPPTEPYQKVVSQKGRWYSDQVAFDGRSNLVVGYTGGYDTRVEEPTVSMSVNEKTVLTGIHVPYEGLPSGSVELTIRDSRGNVYQGFTARAEVTGTIRETGTSGNSQTGNTLYTFVPESSIVLPKGDYVLQLNGRDLPVDAYLVKGYNQAAYERYQDALIKWSAEDEADPDAYRANFGNESILVTYDEYSEGDESEEPSWSGAPADRIAPAFQLEAESVLDEIILSMWHGGKGALPGLISLQNEAGQEIASFQAQGASQGGVPNTLWVAMPGITLPAGIYYIIPDDPEALDYDESGEPVFHVGVSISAPPPVSFTGTYRINLDLFKTSTLMGPVNETTSSFSLRDHELVVLDKGSFIELISQYEGMPFSQNCEVTERTDDTVMARLRFSADLSNLPYAAKIGADAIVTLTKPERGMAKVAVGGTGFYQRAASAEKGADYNTYDVKLDGAMVSKDLPPFVMAALAKSYGVGNIPGPDTPIEAAAGMLFPPLVGVLVNALQTALKPKSKAKTMRDKEWYKKQYPGRTDEQLAIIMMADALGASGGDEEDAVSIGDNERPGGADYVPSPEPSYGGYGVLGGQEEPGEDLSFGKPDVPEERPVAAAVAEPVMPATPEAPESEAPAEPAEPETMEVQVSARGSTILITRDPATGGWVNAESGNPFDLEKHQREFPEYVNKFNEYVERNEELERTGQTAMQQKLDEIKQEYEKREALVDWMRRMQGVAKNRGMGEKGEIDDMYGRLASEIDRVDSGDEINLERIGRIRDYIGSRIEGDIAGPDDAPDVAGINWTNRGLWTEALGETGRNLSQVTNKDGSISWKGLVGRTAIGLLTGGTSEWVFTPMGSVYTMKDAVDRGESGLSAASQGVQQAVIQYGIGKLFGGALKATGGAVQGSVKGAMSGGLRGGVTGGLKGGWQGLKTAGGEMVKEGSDLFSRQAWNGATQKMGQSLSGGAKRIGNILTGKEGFTGVTGKGASAATSAAASVKTPKLSSIEQAKLNQFNAAVGSKDPSKVVNLYKNGGMKDLSKLQQKGVIPKEAAEKINQALRSEVNDSIQKGTKSAISDFQKTTRVRVEEVIVGDSGSSARSAVTRLKTDFDRTLIPKFNQADVQAYAKLNNMSAAEAYDDLCKQFTKSHQANVDQALVQKGLDAQSVGFKSYDRIGSSSGQTDSYAEGFTNARQAASGSGEVFKVKADGSIRSYQTSGQTVVDQNQLNKAIYKTGDILDNPTAVPPREVPSIVNQQVMSVNNNPADPLAIAKALGRTEKGANLLGGSLQDPKLTRAAAEIYENPGSTSEVLKKFGFTDAAGNADPSKFCRAGRMAVTEFDQTLKSIQPGV